MGLNLQNNVKNQRKSPAIVSDALASFPVVSLDDLILIRQDAPFGIYQDINGVRTLIASPGGAATPTLQNVTDSGATTTNTITVAGLVLPGTTLQYVRGNGSLATLPVYLAGTDISITGGVTINDTSTLNTVMSRGASTNYLFTSDIGTSPSGNNVILARVGAQGRWGIGLVDADGVNTGSNFFIYTYLDNGTPVTALKITRATGALILGNTITATALIKSGGTAAQFLKADGSIDSSTYLTTASAAATYQVTMVNGTDINISGGNTINNTSTLATVTGRGATTTTAITVNANASIFGTNGAAGIGLRVQSGSGGSGLRIYGRDNAGVDDGGISFYKYDQATAIASIYTRSDIISIRDATNVDVLVITGGVTATTGRLNVNGAADNALFALNVQGCTYTNSFSPTASTKTVSFTVGDNVSYYFTGAAGQTATMENPSGTNKIFFIKNWSSNTLAVAGYAGGTNIIDLTNTAVASFNLLLGQTAMLQQDGNSRTFILNIY